MLKEWSKKLIAKVVVIGRNIKQYVNMHPLKEDANVNYTKDWIQNVQVFIGNYQTYDGDDIRRFIYRRKMK
jgi:hypothetical protein